VVANVGLLRHELQPQDVRNFRSGPGCLMRSSVDARKYLVIGGQHHRGFAARLGRAGGQSDQNQRQAFRSEVASGGRIASVMVERTAFELSNRDAVSTGRLAAKIGRRKRGGISNGAKIAMRSW